MSEEELKRLEKIARQNETSSDSMTIALFPRDVLNLIAEVRKWRNMPTIEAKQ